MDATERQQRAEQWAVVMADWRESGQAMAGYCRAHGLAYCQFLYWREKLGSKASAVTAAAGGAGRTGGAAGGASAFVPIEVERDGDGIDVAGGVGTGGGMDGADSGIRVRLTGGQVELVLVRGFAAGELRRAVAALGAVQC